MAWQRKLKPGELSKALKNGDIALAGFLIEAGADINEVDPENGYTPLHYVICYERPFYLAKKLIERGAALDVQDKAHMTPLMYAVSLPAHNATTVLLIEKGADVSKKNVRWRTALYFARVVNNKEAVSMIMEAIRLQEQRAEEKAKQAKRDEIAGRQIGIVARRGEPIIPKPRPRI